MTTEPTETDRPHDEPGTPHDDTETLPLLVGPAPYNAHGGIAALLEQVGLAVPDEEDAPVQMMAAFAGPHLVGCIGWEQFGPEALLRSLAVHPHVRGEGVGQALVSSLLEVMQAFGIRQVVLLTNDAAGYFTRFGFQAIERHDVPAGVQQSKEFTLSSCRTAQAMSLALGGADLAE